MKTMFKWIGRGVSIVLVGFIALVAIWTFNAGRQIATQEIFSGRGGCAGSDRRGGWTQAACN